MHLNQDQLRKLHSDFEKYRDIQCNGYADIGIDEFYKQNKSKYEAVRLNQCDGCSRDLPVVNGLHRSINGHPVMVCTAGLYA